MWGICGLRCNLHYRRFLLIEVTVAYDYNLLSTSSLPRFEEVESAERELAQLQNARAIAAVQREAHRIAQRLDSTAEAEVHMQLYAQNQAEMVSCPQPWSFCFSVARRCPCLNFTAVRGSVLLWTRAVPQIIARKSVPALQDIKLRQLEENLRNQVREEAARNLQEVRKESLGNLHDVASMFVQQLSRNKVAHATVQTYSPPPPPPKPEVGVQVRGRSDCLTVHCIPKASSSTCYNLLVRQAFLGWRVIKITKYLMLMHASCRSSLQLLHQPPSCVPAVRPHSHRCPSCAPATRRRTIPPPRCAQAARLPSRAPPTSPPCGLRHPRPAAVRRA